MIPNGWEIKKMSDVVIWGSGGTPKATEAAYYENGTIPWVVIGDLNDGVVNSSASKITELGLKNSSAKLIPPGTLLVAMYGSIGKLGITGIECCTNQAIAFAKELHGVTTQYMFYYMVLIKAKLISMGKGGTQKNISQAVLKSLDVIVPPLSEQKHIVFRIEELFSQLDASVAKLKTAKERLKVYRQAVLKEAFEKVKVHIPFGKIIDARLGKMLDKEKNTGNYRKYLRNINVRWFSFDLSDLLEMRIEDDEIEKYSVSHNDLIICEGGEPGRCAVWDKHDSIFYQKALHRVRFSDNSNPKFYMYYLWFSAQTGQLCRYFTGTGIKHLTGQSLSKVVVPKTDRPTQDSIVAEIESRLSVCDSIEKTVETALLQAKALQQSILKKAFEGRLL